jgi:phosphoglycolate phosphatase
MNGRRLRGILFDLDGTLVSTLGHWADAYVKTLEAFGGPALSAEAWLAEYYPRMIPLDRVLAMVGIGAEHERRFRRIRDDDYVARLAQGAEWMGSAGEVLRALADDFALGIVTAAAPVYVDAMDRKLRVRSFVQAVVTGKDTGARGKPDPYGLELGAEALGLAPETCAYVGDQAHDIEAAKNAGMTSILVPNPVTQKHAYPEADHVLGSIDELPSVLLP